MAREDRTLCLPRRIVRVSTGGYGTTEAGWTSGVRSGPRLHGDERVLRRARRRGIGLHHPPRTRARDRLSRHCGHVWALPVCLTPEDLRRIDEVAPRGAAAG